MHRKLLLLIVVCSLVALAVAGWTWDDGHTLGLLLGR